MLSLAAVLAAGFCGAVPAAVKPSTAVIIGDSFAAGQAGRWGGNSFQNINGGDRADTDLAAFSVVGGWTYDLDVPYLPNSIENGCNRARWSPITYLEKHANLYPQGFDEVINLACSGARNKHLWPIENGGQNFKGESPQIPRLANIAVSHDIDLVVIGAGGNDMGFADAVKECVIAWALKHWTPADGSACDDEIRSDNLPKLGDAFFNLAKTVRLVKEQMADVGDTDYDIVLLGYPAIIPRSNGYAYAAGDRRIKQCPFNGPDSDFVENVLMPKLNATIEAVASQEGVDFIGLHHAFDEHRLCEAGLGERMVEVDTPTSHNTEWVRYLDSTLLTFDMVVAGISRWADLASGVTNEYIAGAQGSLSESLHPNYFGQQAVGDCLRAYRAGRSAFADSFACRNNGSGHATDMRVDTLAAPSVIEKTSDVAIPSNGTVNIHANLSAGSEPGKILRSELRVDHPLKGQLRITLRSPSGKVYQLRDFNPNDGGAFPSVAKNFFYDAPAESGSWTLKIEDGVAGTAGTFRDWKAYFY